MRGLGKLWSPAALAKRLSMGSNLVTLLGVHSDDGGHLSLESRSQAPPRAAAFFVIAECLCPALDGFSRNDNRRNTRSACGAKSVRGRGSCGPNTRGESSQ